MTEVNYFNAVKRPDWATPGRDVLVFDGTFNAHTASGRIIEEPSALLAVVEVDGNRVDNPEWYGIQDKDITTDMLEFTVYRTAGIGFGDVKQWLYTHAPVVRLYAPRILVDFRFVGESNRAGNEGWLRAVRRKPEFERGYRKTDNAHIVFIKYLHPDTKSVTVNQIMFTGSRSKESAEDAISHLKNLFRKVI